MVRKFSILGDSISTFAGYIPAGWRVYYDDERCAATGVHSVEDTWWMQVINALGGELLANASFSGSLVEGSQFPAGCSEERIAALACNDVAPDVVLVFMGTNDFGWGGAAVQDAARGTDATPDNIGYGSTQGAVASTAAFDAVARFEMAYDLLLRRVRANFPQAQVWCCTLCPGRVAGQDLSTFTYQLRGIHLDSYNDAIRQAAARQCYHVADVWEQGFDYEGIDGTHPTAVGMKQLASMVVRSMGNYETALPIPEQAFRSHQSCTRTSCIGCPDAAGTGNSWMLVCNRNGLCL